MKVVREVWERTDEGEAWPDGHTPVRLCREFTIPPIAGGDIEWLTHATNAMLRCRSVAALLDLAYDAIRSGPGFDRVGLLLLDGARHALVERIGTDEDGTRFYPTNRVYPLDGDACSS